MAAIGTEGKLEDLEVLTIGSGPIDKTLEETIAEKAVADATERGKQQQICPLVAAVLAAEAVKAAAVAEDSNIRQRMMVEMRQKGKEANKKKRQLKSKLRD